MPDAHANGGWTKEQPKSLVSLTEIEPDLSEIVNNRQQRATMMLWIRHGTDAAVTFLKWAAAITGAVIAAKAYLVGWFK